MKKYFAFSLLLLITVAAQLRASKFDYIQLQKVVASDRSAGALFGYSVAISGNFAIVGAPEAELSGVAYIYKRDAKTDAWTQVNKLSASDRDNGDYFGTSVSISGDYAVIGADLTTVGGITHAGTVYIFKRNYGLDTWSEVYKVIASDGRKNKHFGYSVAINGDNLIVGVYDHLQGDDHYDGYRAGSAYIFKRNNGKESWTQTDKITPNDGKVGDQFGYSVAINDDYAFVGAVEGYLFNGGSGSVYIYKKDAGTNKWIQTDKIKSNVQEKYDSFGASISISYNKLIVGALGYNSNYGAAFIFDKVAGTDTWVQIDKLVAKDGAFADYFGNSVSISGNVAIVGTERNSSDPNDTRIGPAYIFWRDAEAETWSQVEKIVAKDGTARDDYFGSSVAMDGDYSIVGAYIEDEDENGQNTLKNAGSAYVYKFTTDPYIYDFYTLNKASTYLLAQANLDIGGTSTTFQFAYGTESGNYDFETIPRVISGSSTTVSVENWITNLLPSSTYYVVAEATNNMGKNVTNELVFETCKPVSSTLTDTLCGWFVFNSQTYTESGQYSQTFSKIDGCDSVLVLDLIIYPIYSFSIADTICAGTSYEIGSQTITKTGEYIEFFNSFDYCDSVVTVYVTVLDEIATSFNESICQDDFYYFEGDSLNISGEYSKTFDSSGGCDSIVTLNLKVTNIFTDLTLTSTTLKVTEEQVGAKYQWLDCLNDNAEIIGETSKAFTPKKSGEYAVKINIGDCSEISDCVGMIIKGVKDNHSKVTLYPNPSTGEFTIKLDKKYFNVKLSITDALGKEVYQNNYPSTQIIESAYNLSSGYYTVNVFSDNKIISSVAMIVK